MTSMTTTTGAVFIPEVWAKDIQITRKNKLVAAGLVDHQYESQILSQGDIVHITSIAPVTVSAITQGTPIVPAAATETEQTLVVNQYYGGGFEIQDMLKKQSAYDLRAPYTTELSFALANQIDSSILALATSVIAGNKMAAIAALTFNAIIDAHVLLDAANVPQEDRALVVNSAGLGDLRKVAEFTMWDKTGVAGLVKENLGLVGTIYGTPVYVTNAVQKLTGAAMNLLLHKSAFAVAIQLQPDVEYFRDIFKKSDNITVSALWGVKCVRPDHAVVINRTQA